MLSAFVPEPGDIIAGKYRIERMLGSGGMGAVFEASHCITRKRFAIKWLTADQTHGDEAVARFVREAQISGLCRHDSLVEVYDIDRERDSLFMVMELLEGETLADRLDRRGVLSVGELCELLMPCMEAIAEAHAAGVIHRDLKPDNIFVCRARGRVPEIAKVLDFGVSRIHTPDQTNDLSMTVRGTVIGTPFYMPPEQFHGAAIDQRVDVYAMGATLYEALSGDLPYQASTAAELFVKVVSSDPIPLSQKVPHLSPGLSEVVGRAMSRERALRYSSMHELIAALQPYQRASASAPPLMAAPANRRPRRHWIVLTCLLLLAVGAVYGAVLKNRGAIRFVRPPPSPSQRY